MPGRMQFDFSFSQPGARRRARSEDEAVFRILVMGDFSGREPGSQPDTNALSSRGLLKIDLDNFEQVMRRLHPRVALSPPSVSVAGEPIEFRAVDDFHPDRLYRDLPLFSRFKDLRRRLLDPNSFDQAAAELGVAPPAAEPAPGVGAAPAPAPGTEAAAAMVERLLGRKPGAGAGERTAAATPSPIDALLRRAVAPHIQPGAPAFQEHYLAAVDAAAAEAMHGLLHLPRWQAIESAWRGVYWLVTTLELGETLEVYLLDVSRSELDADVAQADGSPEHMMLYRRLVEDPGRDSDARNWALLVGLYRFEPSGTDARTLGMLGVIASRAGGPFVAEASPAIVGASSLAAQGDPRQWQAPDDEAAEDWRALRTSAVAPWLGLALPRILLRLPYGAKTDPIDSFPFEELDAPAAHEHYLWGNPALACALLLGQSFQANGWDMACGDQLEVGDLPAHIVEAGEEKRMQACAEVFLTERAAEAILERGPMPLASYRNRNAARLLRFQSLALPAKALAGPWAD
ncbi:MAG: type VI secretion system contractile sheath large subunit [Burkholderiales bacterium]|nr:type VI secretion system contractile sheath large subunit [Burkholderiales bacterium]